MTAKRAAVILGVLLPLAAAAAADEGRYDAGHLARARIFIDSNPDFGARFTRAWEEVLSGLKSAQAHSRFIRKRGTVSLTIADPGEELRERTAALYVNGEVYVNRIELVLNALSLENRGVPRVETPRLLAWKMMPLLVHEIRHGITEEELRTKAGANCPMASLEDERVAFFDQIRVAQEIIGRKPRLWDDALLIPEDVETGSLLAAWSGHPDGLERYVEEIYVGKDSVLASSRTALLAKHEGLLAELKSLLRKSRELRGSRSGGEKTSDERRLERYARNSAACVKMLKSPREFKAYQAYYRARLKTIDREWRRQRKK